MLRIILYALAVLAIIFIIAMIVVGITMAVEGDGGGAEEVSGDSSAIVLMGKYGAIFSVAFVIICFSAGIIAGYFKKTSNKNRFILGFILAVILAFIFTGLPYAIHHRGDLTVDTHIVSPFIESCYDNMPVPWLCSIMWCLAAAGSLAAAIYFGIRKMKASEY